ncbi:MAG: NAD(P)-dependent alcohol dehydrogenase, partial [Rhodospirillaceae bacterium]|nr:NAD(P)-dependent alcohol dehydrogenase [Rhodospirillaceae bacterium]
MRIIQAVPFALALVAFAPSIATTAEDGAARPKAYVFREYGAPMDVMHLEEVDKPVPNENQVLIKVHASSANPADWHRIRGVPYLIRFDSGLFAPETPHLGIDVAGVIEAVGSNVTKFKPGDEIFGVARGAFGEYAIANQRRVAIKPVGMTFAEAAGVPVGAVTALQALQDKGQVQPGQKVLINGASGGVGTYAVQIAKALGAEVTAVCSTRNVELVRSLGADHVVDYTKEDFAEAAARYDVVLDNVGNRSLSDIRRVLTPTGIHVLVGGGWLDGDQLIGPFS